MKVCLRCGREFEPKDDRPNRPARYCSRKCGQPNQPSRVTLTCRQCGRQFERKRYMEQWSQDRGPFCGFRCYGQWQKEHIAGEANPNYQPQSNRRQAAQWERNRLAVLERDGHRCVRCGSTKRLHVHHREAWQAHQADPHALDNLETLCASCHRKSHPLKQAPDGCFLPNR